MGNTATLEFIGLHLFYNDDQRPMRKKKIAVINASRNGVVYRGEPLDPHAAYIAIKGTAWPFELSGHISFEVGSDTSGVDDTQWHVPKLRPDPPCRDFSLDPFFFTGFGGNRHAIIDLDTGRLTTSRTDGGAIITCATITYEGQFEMKRKDRWGHVQSMSFTGEPTIRFVNTEIGPSLNDLDWLWYFEATGNSCMHGPTAPTGVPAYDGDIGDCDIRTLSLGCSNSNWP